ncbi:hypothetical protein H312_02372 [Anncaliia algerae PRA339]|uniref:Uncharacterized protein n=1 Tax=Anncaliia algerae PRA339 TaxID=1288291 RepID=A0A059EZC6_9MICR|nr:hypothetical protein H312_02372 [Anncaliia algerae PRA339]
MNQTKKQIIIGLLVVIATISAIALIKNKKGKAQKDDVITNLKIIINPNMKNIDNVSNKQNYNSFGNFNGNFKEINNLVDIKNIDDGSTKISNLPNNIENNSITTQKNQEMNKFIENSNKGKIILYLKKQLDCLKTHLMSLNHVNMFQHSLNKDIFELNLKNNNKIEKQNIGLLNSANIFFMPQRYPNPNIIYLFVKDLNGIEHILDWNNLRNSLICPERYKYSTFNYGYAFHILFYEKNDLIECKVNVEDFVKGVKEMLILCLKDILSNFNINYMIICTSLLKSLVNIAKRNKNIEFNKEEFVLRIEIGLLEVIRDLNLTKSHIIILFDQYQE